MKKRFTTIGLMGALLLGSLMTASAQEAAAEAETEIITETEMAAEAETSADEEAVTEAQSEETVTAEETEAAPAQPDFNHLTVAGTTPFDGAFSTGMWSNVSSDIDVRTLIHGYNLIEWDFGKSVFAVDPSVVSGITVTDNQAGDRTYLLTIYDDLMYCDGTPITAADYAFSMLLSVAPEAEEIGAALKHLDYVIGYDDYRNGRTAYFAGIRIVGEHMLSITVSNEYLPFFYEMALLDCVPYPISQIAPGCVVRDDGNGVYIANEDETLTEPVFTAALLEETILDPETGYLTHPAVTSGPYRLTDFDGTTAEFELNPYYKGNSKGNMPSIEQITYTIEANEDLIGSLADGSVTLLNKVMSAATLQDGLQFVGGNDDFTMTNYARNGLSFISFCCEKQTVAEPAVRQAIAMCLDKDKLVEDYVGNYGMRVDGYYGVGQWMYALLSGTMAYPVEEPENPDDEAAKQAYEDELKEWEDLSLDNVTVYGLDPAAAAALLEQEGWTLNEAGEPFDPETDAIRCKEIDGELTALDLTMLVPEDNRIADSLEEAFVKNLAQAGIALQVQTVPMQQLLSEYYRQEARECDLIYLATNFDVVFDPSETFRPEETDGEDAEEEDTAWNIHNTTGIADEQLYELAVDMRRTEPGDTLSYCKKWVAFQERFAQVLPCIPVYSNVYFDLYSRTLQNYNITENISWGQEIVNAFLSDIPEEETESESESEELAEGEAVFD